MNDMDGRVVVVTGAGRGLGRSHAVTLAARGARVVVNDLGGALDGAGRDASLAANVVEMIQAAGGEAIPSDHDVSTWAGAKEMVDLAVDHFGDLDVLVNNAGILRDSAFANMDEAAWDSVIAVHLKGHAASSKHALAYWRRRHKSGTRRDASIIHTTSVAAFTGNFGQANYSSAKAGIIGLSRAIAIEGAPYGVRSNAISPSARTRMTFGPSSIAELDPLGVSRVVGWLAGSKCPVSSQVYHCMSRRVVAVEGLRPSAVWESDEEFTPQEIDQALRGSALTPATIDDFLGFSID